MPSLADLLEEAKGRPLAGWDLSCDGRIGYAAPWDFEAIVDAWIGSSPDLLDMGTGGGEWLSRRPFPKDRTAATEAWPPNVPLAQAKLAPLGARVVAVADAPDNSDQAEALALPALPFADAAFHLIVNRHEAFVASEVARVLAPGGRFVTQQVGPELAAPFRALLGARRRLRRRHGAWPRRSGRFGPADFRSPSTARARRGSLSPTSAPWPGI